MKRTMSITTLCLASLLPALGHAAEGNLNSSVRGDYAFTGDAACIGSPNGFNGFHPAPPAYMASFSVEGVRRFNGDGTGTILSGRVVGFGMGQNPSTGNLGIGAATVSTFTGAFTYRVALDRTIHIDQGPLTSVQIVGPDANTQRATEIWRGIQIDGHVSQDFKTISTATAAPDPGNSQGLLEFGSNAGAAPGQPPEVRACHRSRVMVRINSGPGRDD